MIGGQKQEGSDIIVQILVNGKDRTRKYDKFGNEIQYNITSFNIEIFYKKDP